MLRKLCKMLCYFNGESLSIPHLSHLYGEVRSQVQLAQESQSHLVPELLSSYPAVQIFPTLLSLCLVKCRTLSLSHSLFFLSLFRLSYQQLIDQPFWLHGWKSFSLSVVRSSISSLGEKDYSPLSHTLCLPPSLSTPLRACL